MKVIFLDIDGVMNSEIFYRERHKRRWRKPKTYYYWIKAKIKYILNGFKHKPTSLANYKPSKKSKTFEYKFKRVKEETDQQKWQWLIELCEETGAKICISSVWKNHFEKQEDWSKTLDLLGFPEGTYVGRTQGRRTLRGTEIKEWMEKVSIPIEKYVILDDDSDMLPEQMKYYYHCDHYFGLTPNITYRIKNYFNNINEYNESDNNQRFENQTNLTVHRNQ